MVWYAQKTEGALPGLGDAEYENDWSGGSATPSAPAPKVSTVIPKIKLDQGPIIPYDVVYQEPALMLPAPAVAAAPTSAPAKAPTPILPGLPSSISPGEQEQRRAAAEAKRAAAQRHVQEVIAQQIKALQANFKPITIPSFSMPKYPLPPQTNPYPGAPLTPENVHTEVLTESEEEARRVHEENMREKAKLDKFYEDAVKKEEAEKKAQPVWPAYQPLTTVHPSAKPLDSKSENSTGKTVAAIALNSGYKVYSSNALVDRLYNALTAGYGAGRPEVIRGMYAKGQVLLHPDRQRDIADYGYKIAKRIRFLRLEDFARSEASIIAQVAREFGTQVPRLVHALKVAGKVLTGPAALVVSGAIDVANVAYTVRGNVQSYDAITAAVYDDARAFTARSRARIQSEIARLPYDQQAALQDRNKARQLIRAYEKAAQNAERRASVPTTKLNPAASAQRRNDINKAKEYRAQAKKLDAIQQEILSAE